jgi:hypothetical protein
MLVFRYASAILQILATALIIPLSAVAFTLPAIMGADASPLRASQVFAIGLIISGLVIYKTVIRFNIQYFKYSFGMTSSETRLPLSAVSQVMSQEESHHARLLDRLIMFAHRLSMAKKYGRSWLEKARRTSMAESANYHDDICRSVPGTQENNHPGLAAYGACQT